MTGPIDAAGTAPIVERAAIATRPSGFPGPAFGAMIGHDHEVPAISLWRIRSSIGAALQGGSQGSRQARLRCLEQRMLGFKGPAQPSPTLGDALNAGYGYLEVRCLGCDTHSTVALDIVRRSKANADP
jgi:hypothetical protein